MAKKYQTSLGEQNIFQRSAFLQHEEVKRRITVLPELEALIPPLNDDEKAQLEANIIKEGCREALLIWPTTEMVAIPGSLSQTPVYILVDGHNRYRICRHNNIDFPVHFVRYESLDEVRAFMIDNQLGRRNLSPEQTSYLRGIKYLNVRQAKGKYERIDHKDQNDPYDLSEVSSHKDQNDPYGQSLQKRSTAEQLAAEFNVGQATIKRDAEYAQGLDMLTPSLKSAVLSGKSKVSKQIIQQLAKSSGLTEKLDSVEAINSFLNISPVTESANVPSVPKTRSDAHIMKDFTRLLKEVKSSSGREALCKKMIELVTQLTDAER